MNQTLGKPMNQSINQSRNFFSQLIKDGAHQKLLAFASLIALLIIFSVTSPNFMQISNMIAILQATSVNGVLAIAATLVIITGGIDLSVGTLMTFTAVIAGVALGMILATLPKKAHQLSLCSRKTLKSLRKRFLGHLRAG